MQRCTYEGIIRLMDMYGEGVAIIWNICKRHSVIAIFYPVVCNGDIILKSIHPDSAGELIEYIVLDGYTCRHIRKINTVSVSVN